MTCDKHDLMTRVIKNAVALINYLTLYYASYGLRQNTDR